MIFDPSTPPKGTVRDWLDSRADAGGIAFVFPETGEELNWQDLRDHAVQVSGDMTAQGIKKGGGDHAPKWVGWCESALFSSLWWFRATMLNLAAGRCPAGYAMEHCGAVVAFCP